MLTEKLQKSYPSLTKQQKKVAEFFLSHGPEAAFLSVAQLSQQVKTSQASVVRFSRAIGFKGYPELQQELQNWVRQKVSPVKVLQNLMGKQPKENVYARIFQMDMQNLRETEKAISQETLDRVVNEIIRARRIGFIGYRTSRAVAYLLYYHLSRVRKNCEILDTGNNLTTQLINFGPGDLLMAVSFPRYGRQTFEILKYGKKVGCRTIAITDAPISPPSQVADIVLLAERESAAYFNSFTSAVTLVNCLAAGVSLKSKRSLEMLKAFDQIDNDLKSFMI
ncbi:MAG: MurR/RpiR family transcriptional regulator [Thermodesulfobacteriota bacterium]|nr:MurR/RpiR family transcriptional regulator [Thermodesulfobacteriota bacterium]